MRQGPSSGSDTDGELRALGRELQRAREDAGLEQLEAAQSVGISRVTLSRYENGRQRPPHDVIVRLTALYQRRSASDTPRTVREGSAGTPYSAGLSRQLQLLALDFEREMIESDIDEEFIRYARARLRDPELLELYGGGHTDRPMTADEQRDDYEDLVDELRGRLKRRLELLKKRERR